MHIPQKTMDHLRAHGGKKMIALAEKVFGYHNNAGTLTPFTPLTLEFPEEVGFSECLVVAECTMNDEILVQKRTGRTKWSRAVNQKPEPTNFVTIIVNRNWDLVTAYCGKPAPREPWDPSMDKEQFLESIEFWSYHALCLHKDAEITYMRYFDFCKGVQ